MLNPHPRLFPTFATFEVVTSDNSLSSFSTVIMQNTAQGYEYFARCYEVQWYAKLCHIMLDWDLKMYNSTQWVHFSKIMRHSTVHIIALPWSREAGGNMYCKGAHRRKSSLCRSWQYPATHWPLIVVLLNSFVLKWKWTANWQKHCNTRHFEIYKVQLQVYLCKKFGLPL